MFPVTRKRFVTLCLSFVLAPFALPSGAAEIDPQLKAAMQAAGPADVLTAIVTYNAKTTAGDVATLTAIGVKAGVRLKHFPMIGVWATRGQLEAIAAQPAVRSLYSNSRLQYHNDEGTAMIGARKQRTIAGLGFTGAGIGVAVVDSGVDATHPDLPLGTRVKQNSKMMVGGKDIDDTIGTTPTFGIVPPTWVEGVPHSDANSGHGTHVAGIIGGTGAQSQGQYAGVAPGADIIGISTGEVIAVLWALAGWDYVMEKRGTYNIRVVNNSWGTSGIPFDPNSPTNLASKIMHDAGLTVVFSSGNSGPGSNTLNPYSVAPWVIGVAAATKRSHLSSFSSRGIKDDPLYRPTITGPGQSIVSCRAKGTAIGAASGDIVNDPNLAPEHLPFYAHLSGTSMSGPMVAGTIALMLEANPNLSPDQVKAIIEKTATRMVGYERHQVGSGFLNAMAAVDAARNAAKTYGTVLNQTFHARLNGTQTTTNFALQWDPTLPPPTYPYTVDPNGIQSDVFITWTMDANTFNLGVKDPDGTVTSTGSDLLWLLNGLSASLSFNEPKAGNWLVTVWGLRGQSSGTTGIGVPDAISGTIVNYYGTFSGLTDIATSPYASYIRRAVALRLMDSFANGTFKPNSTMSRLVVAKMLASNTYTRQNLTAPFPFTDVANAYKPYVAAVTSPGAPMRDVYMAQPATMSGATATTFSPNSTFTRADLAVWLVRSLGLEAEAQANMSTATTYLDDPTIPASKRGYVVVASNLGLMPGSRFKNSDPPVYYWRPGASVLRGEMAEIACKWHDLFFQP